MASNRPLRIKKRTRNFGTGGAVGASVVDPNGSDFEAINAERTARWAADDAANKAKYGIKAAGAPFSDNRIEPGPNSLSSVALQLPAETTWQQDMDARQSRISGYADKLRGMEQAGRANSLMGSSSSISTGYADGGKIDADELMRQMTEKYGAPAAGPAPKVPQAAQQPKPQPEAQKTPAGIVGILKGRQQQIDKAAGYANGGKPRGIAWEVIGDRNGEGAREIKGPGTPTSDSIPAKVRETGEPINVSTEERIVSHAQGNVLEHEARQQGFKSLDDKLEALTGKPVGPTIKAGKRGAANGLSPEDEVQAAKTQGLFSQPLRTKDVLPGGYIDRGAGILASREPTGRLNVTNVGTQGIADMGKQIVDGSASALIDQKNSTYNPARQLANMQRLRLDGDAFDPGITDPNVRDSARAQIAEQDKLAGKAGETQGRMLDNQIKTQSLTRNYLLQGLQNAYLNEQDPARRNELANRISAIQGKGGAAPTLQHVETENGIMTFDPRTGTLTQATTPGGMPIKGNKPLTEFQGKSTGFGMRAENASGIIDRVGKGGEVQPSLLKRAVEDIPLVGGGLGMIANKTQSPEQQQIEQAQRDFVNAVLRQESGAAISKSEFDNAKLQYFPQPGDSPKVIAQKKANREMAVNGFRISAGPGEKNFGGAESQSQEAGAPKIGTIDGNHVYIGGNPADPASWKAVQ